MNNSDGRVWYGIGLDTSEFQRQAQVAKNEFKSINQTAVSAGEGIDQTFKRMTAAAGAYLSLQFASNLGKQIISVRGEFQQLGIAFETMLGSKEKADKLMSEAVTFAAKTPFTLQDVATNIKQLMAMGIATEDVMGTMKSLGDVAAGVSVPIARVAVNYGQVATLGKLQGRELRDFAMAGIPLVDELAKNLGKTKSEITDMVTASKIGFPEVERAFQTMTGEGGKFYNLMEKQNASVTGQISNLTDKWQVMLNEIGKSNEGAIYSGIAGLSNLVTHYEDILDVLKVLVGTYGIYKAAVISVAAYESVLSKIDATRTTIISAKVAALNAQFAAEDAAAAQAVKLAAEEAARTSVIIANETAQATASARVMAAKEANAAATQQLAEAELELQIVQARNTAAYGAGLLTLKESQNVKKELAAVDLAYSNLKKTELAVDQSITAETVVNERIKSQAVKTGEAEKTAAKIQAKEASRALMIANEEATASEIALASVNPWLIAAAGIAVLLGAIVYFRKEVKTTDDYMKDLTDSISAMDKQIEVESMISKYESLKDKVGKTKDEQSELNKSVQYLSTIFPDAISGVDKYGKAVDLVTDKLYANNEELRKQIIILNETKVANTESELERKLAYRKKLVEELKTGLKAETIGSGYGGSYGSISAKSPLSTDELNKNRVELEKLNVEVDQLTSKLTEDKQKLYDFQSIDAEQALEPYKELFKKVEEFTKDQAIQAISRLNTIKDAGVNAVNGSLKFGDVSFPDINSVISAAVDPKLGGRANAKIDSQILSLQTYVSGLKSVKYDIEKTQNDLLVGEKKLSELRNPTHLSANAEQEITEQEDANKALRQKLEVLTGIKKKESEKQIKNEQEKIDALKELKAQELDIELSKQRAIIGLMNDGIDKQKALRKQSLADELTNLDKQQQDYLEKLNKTKGNSSTDKGYITSLDSYVAANPNDAGAVSFQKSINDQKLIADQQYVKDVEKLDEDAATNRKKVFASATESFLSDIEKEKAAISEKYTAWIKDATENGASQSQVDQLTKLQNMALSEVSSKYALKLSSFYQDIFGNVDELSAQSLRNLRVQLDEVISSAQQINKNGQTLIQVTIPTDQFTEDGERIQKTVDMTIEEFQKLKESGQNLNDRFIQLRPFESLIENLAEYGKATKEVGIAQKEYDTLLNSGTASAQELAEAYAKLKKVQDGQAASSSSAQKSIDKSVAYAKSIIDSGNEIISVLEDMGISISDNTKKGIEGIGDMIDAFGEIDLTKPASVLSAAIKYNVGVYKTLSGFLGKKDTSISDETFASYQRLIDAIDQVISKQKEMLDSLSGVDATAQYNESIALIKRQIEATIDIGNSYLSSGAGTFSHSVGYNLQKSLSQYATQLKQIGIDFSDSAGGISNIFNLTSDQITQLQEMPEVWAAIDDKTREYLQTIVDSDTAINDLKESLNETLTNITFDSAISSLQDLLLSADTTMADVASSFEDNMAKAIVNMITNKDLLPKLEEWYQHFSDAMSDGIVSNAEKIALQAEYEDIYALGKAKTDAAYSAAGINNTSEATQTAATGIANSATEETMSLVYGQTMAMRVDLKSLNEINTFTNTILNASLDVQMKIEKNTRYNEGLVRIENGINETNRLLKQNG